MGTWHGSSVTESGADAGTRLIALIRRRYSLQGRLVGGRIHLLELTLGLGLVLAIGPRRRLHGLRGGRVTARDVNWKVVRAEEGEPLHCEDREVTREEHVIERPAHQLVLRMEGVEHPSPDPRV